ncbi:MAG: hypothetical protein Q7U37_12340 [Gallionella sp.]|nr:hypothetical protein [Gallionella sp.]
MMTRNARFPLLNPLVKQLAIRLSTIKPCKSLVIPQAGEGANESLRELNNFELIKQE